MSYLKRVAVSSIIGNAIEWNDYILYSLFASTMSYQLLPPSENFSPLVMIFSIFATGYVSRPFGAIVFGIIGDKIGRKFALYVSILLIALPTACIGLLPTYSQIGIASTVLLITARLLQGIAIGGEFGSSSIYLIESAPAGRKALFGSLSMMSIALGIITGSVFAFILTSSLTNEEMFSWGWRVPFLCSAGLGFIGFYIRRNLKETKEFEASVNAAHTHTDEDELQSVKHNMFADIILNHKKNIFTTMCISVSDGVPFYVLCVFVKTMLETSMNYTALESIVFGTITISGYGIATVLSGFLADKLGGKRIMMIASLAVGACVIPILQMLEFGDMWFSLLVCFASGMLVGMYHGPLPYVVATVFPTHIRATAMAIGYNIPMVLFGGTAPLVASYIIETTQNNVIVGAYVAICCVIGFIGVFLSKSYTHHEPRF